MLHCMMSQFNSAVYDDVVVVIISNIDKAISFAGTVDPLKGTASAISAESFYWPRMASATEHCESYDAAMVLHTFYFYNAHPPVSSVSISFMRTIE